MERWLRTVNGTARVRSTSYGKLPLEQLLNIDRHAHRSRARPRDAPRPNVRMPAQQRRERRRAWRPPTADPDRRRRRAGASTSATSRARSAGQPAPRDGGRDGGRRAGDAPRQDGSRCSTRKVHKGAINDDRLAARTQARLATAGDDGCRPVFQLGADEPASPSSGRAPVDELVAWSPKGDMLAVAKGHTGYIFAPDGKQLGGCPRWRARSPASPGRPTAPASRAPATAASTCSIPTSAAACATWSRRDRC